MKLRLDQRLVNENLVTSRSQAENYIKLGKVKVNGRIITKAGFLVSDEDKIELLQVEQYVSRAGLKLASITEDLKLDFKGKIILDVGSSTGGFTDFALKHNAQKVIAVDVGTNQLHLSLLNNPKIELHEKTDIRDFIPNIKPDIVLIDVSFISLKKILPHIAKILGKDTQIIAMLKPQFEASENLKNKGIIKNDKLRRRIIKNFEIWVKDYFIIINKADSKVAGTKGNQERFYSLKTKR